MREVRLLEQEIVTYQNELRTNIQQHQLKDYIEIGEETLQEFYVKWQENFEKQEDENMAKIHELEEQHDHQMDLLNEKLGRAVEAAKIKPLAKLREMQHNEKLVAVNERIEEAINYRNELSKLEVQEAERVEKMRQENADKQRRTLQADQKKERQQLLAKIETSRNNLQIKMEKDLNILQKSINLHVNDIKRIQGAVSSLAIKKGNICDELRR